MKDLVDKKGNPYYWKDCETIQNALKRFGFKDNGQLEEYTFDDDATFQRVAKAMVGIEKKLKANPQTKYLIVYTLASHGMNVDGQQVIVLNQFKKSTGFYYTFPFEAKIREIGREFANSYQIGIFACCREI